MSMNNQKVWIVVVVLAVVMAGVAYLGDDYPYGNDKASGTIVPAERYRADQISSEDIVLGDESIAQFMQTDEFEMLVNDEVFMEAIRQESFQAALSNANFQAALVDRRSRASEPYTLSTKLFPLRQMRKIRPVEPPPVAAVDKDDETFRTARRMEQVEFLARMIAVSGVQPRAPDRGFAFAKRTRGIRPSVRIIGRSRNEISVCIGNVVFHLVLRVFAGL